VRWPTIALLLAITIACGAGVRSLRWLAVFRGDTIVYPLGDAYYHMRRAEFTIAHPREILLFDPLVNYPDGSFVPWPPLHTAILAATAEVLGGTKHALELAGAWYPVAIGAATALPLFAAARTLAGPTAALGAAALGVLFPAGVAYSDVGNADHHCTVAFFVAVWLWGALAALQPDPERRPARAAQALVALGRIGVVFTWPGSLLYLALLDGTLVVIAVARGRSDVLRPFAIGLAATALLTAAIVPRLGPPVGGSFSTIALSALHPIAMLALAAVAAAGALLERRRPGRSPIVRLLHAAAVAGIAGAGVLALPGLLAALREGAGFVGKDDPWAALNSEQQPLLPLARHNGWLHPLWYYGGFGYAIPLLPIALAGWSRRMRAPDAVLLLAAWTAVLGALAALQIRYGSDYSPVAGVGFAVALDELRRRAGGARRGKAAVGVALLLGAGPLLAQHVAQARDSLAGAAAPPPPGDLLLATATGSLYRFAEEIRRVTPETDGYFDPAARPAYSILCPANVGHLIHYVAHRATPSDNFGPYSGSRHFASAQRFFEMKSEARAVDLADELGARYVLTVEFGPTGYQGLTQRLHREDGVEREDLPHWEHFRLVTEGPRGGRPLSEIYGGARPPGVAPYKLFERVAGAVLEVHGAPGAAVAADAVVRTPLGRVFHFPIHRQIGVDGVVRLRVPYATDGAAPTGAIEPWRVDVDGARYAVAVSDADVREGRVVPVATP
jgi:dolichyl-diphosphooligosaccharide--protein glycosyltransferase